MARRYIEPVIKPIRSVSSVQGSQKIVFTMALDQTAYAEALDVASRISYAFGHILHAIYELETVARLWPLDGNQSARLKQYKDHHELLRLKKKMRQEARDLQTRKQLNKVEGKYMLHTLGKRYKFTLYVRYIHDDLLTRAFFRQIPCHSKLDLERRQCLSCWLL